MRICNKNIQVFYLGAVLKACSIILALFLCFNLSAEESNKKFIAMLGLGGPLMVLQASATALISYEFCDQLSTDLYVGYSGTASIKDESKDSFAGLGFSFFPLGAKKDKRGVLDKVFIRLAYSYHRIEQEYTETAESTISVHNWIERSHGVEIGVGARVKNGKYVLEFIPLMIFLPLVEDIDGVKEKEYIAARLLNFKFGARF